MGIIASLENERSRSNSFVRSKSSGPSARLLVVRSARLTRIHVAQTEDVAMRALDLAGAWRSTHDRVRGRRPNQFDWLMLLLSFATVAWIVLTR
jgi:hypothetical protein